MQTRLRSKVTLLFVVSALLLAIPAVAALAQDTSTSTAAPTIQSDKADYAPGELVALTGSGWQSGESVHISVNDQEGQTWSRDADVTADASGNISDSFNLPDWFVATYKVTATGELSGVATTSFTDGNVLAKTSGLNLPYPFPWEKFNNNTDCSGERDDLQLPLIFPNVAQVLTGVDNGQSIRMHAPFGLEGKEFVNWTSGSQVRESNVICVAGSTAEQVWTANYGATSVNTTTTASNASATYGASSVQLNATVTPTSGTAAVNTGTVTFTVKNSAGTTIGNPVTSGTVSNGSASASFPLSGVNADTYTIEAAYNAGTGFNASNNSSQSPAPTLTFNKAVTKTTVTCEAGPFTYTGSPHTPCTAKVTGPGGLDQSLPVDYQNNTNAGQATASASYAETANYLGSSDSENFTIDKANATVNITWSNSTYDGNPNSASANASGIGTPPENLGSADSLTYYAGTDTTGTQLSGAPTDAGTYTVKATFGGNDNHTEAAATKTITIAQATPTIEWNNPAVIDHGTALSNTQLNAIVKGVDNSVLAGNSVYTPAAGTVLSAGTHTLKVDFTPTDTVNYKGASKTVQITITVSLYNFGNGFYQPVDNRILNGVKGGSTVPMKFEVFQGLSGNELKSTSAIKTWSTTEVDCDTAATTGEDAIEEYTTGNTSLRFDTTGDYFILNWQAPKASQSAPVGTCYQVSIVANDGSSPNNVLTALYKIR
jgi:hypothetical protein